MGDPTPTSARALVPAALRPKPVHPGVGATVREGLSRSADRAFLGVGALALFVLYSVIVALKSVEVARGARAAGVTARPLVPLPAVVRAVLAGAALVSGLWVELFLARSTAGALLVLAATALAAHLTPRWRRAELRGPGRWLPVA